MSEFLGPIHYLMYEKIKFQDRLTAYLLDQDHLDLLDKSLAPVPLDDLADILDQDNIHGFLSAKIDQVESRLAYAILHGKDIYQKAYALGQTLAPDQLDGPQEVFQAINPLLLDAMPCDQALLASLDSQGRLQLNSQLDCHEKYAASPLTIDPKDSLDKSCQGDHDHHDHESFHIQEGPSLDLQDEEASPYYLLRESLLKGFLEKSGHKVQRIGKNFIISWPGKTQKGAAMIKSIVHIGLSVKDLDRSIDFYQNVLDLHLLGGMTMDGQATDTLFQKNQASVKLAYLSPNKDGSGTLVELIQFNQIPLDKSKGDFFKPSISELCFAVEDIHAFYAKLKSLGVDLLSPPQYFDSTDAGFSKSWAFYFRDPDGIILEAIQYL